MKNRLAKACASRHGAILSLRKRFGCGSDSAAKAARRAGVAESFIMAMGGWRTAATFRRYAIVSSADQKDAVAKIEQARIIHSPTFSPARVGKPS